MRALLLATALLGGCVGAEAVTPEPLGDYTAWHRVDTWGPAPGHGSSYRIIYANDVARTYTGAGQYPLGSVLVKEIRADDDGTPGELAYVAIMRRVAATTGYADEAGWLFTQASTPGGDETAPGFCWERCHAAAPLAGAWLDYGVD